VVVLLVIASRRPSDFHYARSRTIAAPAERIFAEIVDLRRMNKWNPYALRDTTGRADYSGAEVGPGARYDFGGSKSGTGFVELVRANAPTDVGMRLVMTKPMSCDNKIAFRLEPRGAQTQVTWAMSGVSSLMPKLFAMFVDCEKMMAKDFDEGLANLATIVENRPAPALAAE
jgi:hypothetical protein